MEALLKLWSLWQTHSSDIVSICAYLCLAASLIVKLTPTLKDDAWLKPFIKFIGKYIALDKYGPPKPPA